MNRTHTLSRPAWFAAALLSSFASAALAHADDDSARAKLAGAWQVRVTTYDCATGVRNPTFSSLFAFHQGGTASETTANPALLPGQRSPGIGTWRRLGRGYFRVVTEAFILFSSQPPAGVPGPRFTRGLQRIEQGIEVNGDSFKSEATVTFLDESGAPAAPVLCAVAEGRRMEL
jgi:hypothetical protein